MFNYDSLVEKVNLNHESVQNYFYRKYWSLFTYDYLPFIFIGVDIWFLIENCAEIQFYYIQSVAQLLNYCTFYGKLKIISTKTS